MAAAHLGMAVYPGAVLIEQKDGKNEAADVNLAFGDFKLRSQSAAYRTTATEQQMLAFYRPILGEYGRVIECRGKDMVVGTITQGGPMCGIDEEATHGVSVHMHINTDALYELRAGSRLHQHVVGIGTKDDPSRLQLLVVDLPSLFQGTAGAKAPQ